jgi:hypothetical protein
LLVGVLCAAFLTIALPVFPQSVESALARSGYTAVQKESIAAFFREVEDAGIPSEMLLPKLEEGIAKGVPAPRVLRALEREAENLVETRALLLGSAAGERLLEDPASWARAANLLAVGVSEGEIEELVALCGGRCAGFRPASYLYVALREWGLDMEPALDLIGSLLASSIAADEYMGVMDLLAGGRRRRIPPEELIQRIRDNVKEASSIKELETWIY